MPKEYDVNDVHLYISDVMKLDECQRINLWYSIVYGPLPQHPTIMLQRFNRSCLWVQTNILYRFSPIIEKIVREEAQRYATEARIQDRESA